MLLLQLVCLTLADLALHLQQQLNEIPYMPHMPYKVYTYMVLWREGHTIPITIPMSITITIPILIQI